MQAAAAFQLARRCQDLPRLRRAVLAHRNDHPEKLDSQKLLWQRLQWDGEDESEELETRENKHLTKPANRPTNTRRKAQPNNK